VRETVNEGNAIGNENASSLFVLCVCAFMVLMVLMMLMVFNVHKYTPGSI